MKKAIAVLFAMLMVMPFAFADIAVKYDANEKIKGHNVVVGVWEGNEVAVCTNKDKSKGFVVGSVSSKEKFDEAIAKAQSLLDFMLGAGGYEHFGCARVRV